MKPVDLLGVTCDARLERASQSAQRLLAILIDILDLPKIEAGHVRLTPVLYDDAAQEKGLRFEVRKAPALAGRRLLADGLRLVQVLDNLVNHAIKGWRSAGAWWR